MTTINFNVDENVKKQANELFKSLGLDMTTALNLFLRQSINYGGIPFAVKKPRWVVSSQEEVYAKLKESEDAIKSGEKTISHDELWAEMRARYGTGI